MHSHYVFRWVLGVALVATIATIEWGCGTPRPSTSSPKPISSRDSSRALEYYVEGAMHDLRGEYAEAILEYEEALRLDDAASICYAIAKDYYEMHKTARAAHYADAAIARDSSNTLYRALRARIAMNLQMDFAEAQRQFEALVAIDSFDTQTISDLATLYQFRGAPQRAAVLYERLTNIIGPNADIGMHLAQIYSDLGNLPGAIAVLRECLKEDPDDTELRETLAGVFLRAHQRDSAIALYRDLVGRFPDDFTSRRMLANIYSAGGDWNAAFAQYRFICLDSAIETDSLPVVLDSLYAHARTDSSSLDSVFGLIADVADDDTTSWYPCVLAAGCALELRDDSAASDWTREALSRTTDSAATYVSASQIYLEHERFVAVLFLTERAGYFHDFRLHLLRAYALSRLNRRDEAIGSLYRSLEINPQNWLALSELALYHDENKSFVCADSAFEATLILKPDFASALNNFSYSLADRGEQLERAREMSWRALEQDPMNGNYLDTYGWVMYKMSRLDSAAEYIQRAIDRQHPSPTVIEHLGDVQYQRGMHEDAIKLWNEALAIDEHNEMLRDKIRSHASVR